MNGQKLDPIKLLKTFARSISHQPLGPILHLPEPFAAENTCYENVIRKIEASSGNIQYGWTFLHRLTANFESVGYFVATHHAVWRSPVGQLVDITPFHSEPKHRPYAPNDRLYFLVDDKAQLVRIGNVEAPLPLKFFPLNNGKKLLAYVEQLRNNEEEVCQKLYAEYAALQGNKSG